MVIMDYYLYSRINMLLCKLKSGVVMARHAIGGGHSLEAKVSYFICIVYT